MVEYGSLVVKGDGRGQAPASPTDPRVLQAVRDFGLEGRTLFLPHMPYGGTYLLAAAIRSIGFDCWPTTHSDARSMQLGGTVTSGEECYPQKITVGDFLRMIDDLGRDKVAFLMPEANGPCRFGQYRHLIRRTLDDLGYTDVPVITITSNDGYASIGQYSRAPHPHRLASRAGQRRPHEDAVAYEAVRARGRRDRPGLPRRAARRRARPGAARDLRPRAPAGDGVGPHARRATGSAPYRRATTARAR